MKSIARLSLVLLSLTLPLSIAHAKRNTRQDVYDSRDHNQGFRDKHNYPKQDYQDNGNDDSNSSSYNAAAGDSQIVRAVESQRRVNFVEGSGMVVVQILPDDTNGLQHQKWIVRLSNGKLLQAVYNSDMCPRVPLHEGDVVAMGGMFIWTNQGGLIHWLHHDPRGNRPDGYVMVNGTYYCKD